MATRQADNEELIRTFWNRVYAEGDLDFIEDAVAEDCVSHSPAFPDDIRGVEEYREVAGMLREAFPDLMVTLEDVIAEENKVAVRARFSGTHEGPFLDIEPTGETCEIAAMVIYEIKDGRIVEDWHQADMMGLMEQLGVA